MHDPQLAIVLARRSGREPLVLRELLALALKIEDPWLAAVAFDLGARQPSEEYAGKFRIRLTPQAESTDGFEDFDAILLSMPPDRSKRTGDHVAEEWPRRAG